MDDIFKALNDPTRRAILDCLRERDGQTLSDLVDQTALSRFGVMKHLKVLEDSSLVVTRRSGRFKFHYLNAAPLQAVIDRWIEPLLAKPMARLALDLKSHLEGIQKMTNPDFVLELFIGTSLSDLWQALTDPMQIARYYIAGATPKTPIAGPGPVVYETPDGHPMLSGEVLTYEPLKRLEMTFEPHWGDNREASRVVYELHEDAQGCKLTILHFELPAGQEGVKEGWARIASNMKTLLETGTPMKQAS